MAIRNFTIKLDCHPETETRDLAEAIIEAMGHYIDDTNLEDDIGVVGVSSGNANFQNFNYKPRNVKR